jgi:hypothetical protein
MSEYNMQDWLDSHGPVKCCCGADAAKLGTYGHATWCDVYIAPVPLSDNCGCGIGGWHSPRCKHRVWPEEPVDELVVLQNKLKKIAEEL